MDLPSGEMVSACAPAGWRPNGSGRSRVSWSVSSVCWGMFMMGPVSSDGAAGEIAYLPIGGDAFDPGGFKLGTLESAVGSVAMLRRYIGFGGRNASTVADLFAAFNAGEASAVAAIEETARLAAVAIAAIGATLDPELVITGGSIGARPELVNAIRRFLPRCTPYPPRIEISAQSGSPQQVRPSDGVDIEQAVGASES